jgi:hypothetical protein
MNTKLKFRLGLQWGALAWLGYVVIQSVRDALPMAAPWIVVRDSLPKAALWILACALLAVGSRWARAAVAFGILGQLAFGLHEAAWLYPPETWTQLGVATVVRSALHCSGVALCLGMVPLVAWPLEGPRVVLALLALGRFREAWARSGGAVALMAAVPIVALNHATLALLGLEFAPLGLAVLTLGLARYGDVMVAWPWRGRQAG